MVGTFVVLVNVPVMDVRELPTAPPEKPDPVGAGQE
jgi:hypothetical protein